MKFVEMCDKQFWPESVSTNLNLKYEFEIITTSASFLTIYYHKTLITIHYTTNCMRFGKSGGEKPMFLKIVPREKCTKEQAMI